MKNQNQIQERINALNQEAQDLMNKALDLKNQGKIGMFGFYLRKSYKNEMAVKVLEWVLSDEDEIGLDDPDGDYDI